MKKIIALICLLSMVLPLAACSSGIAPVETKEAETKETKTAKETKKTEEKKDEGEIVYPKGFAVGHAMGDITSTPISMYNATAETVHDPLNLTCIALSDGEGGVALIMTADLKGMHRSVFERCTSIIKKEFGIPAENVMISATHTHSAPTVSSGNDTNMIRFVSKLYKQIPVIVEEALRDLDEIEGCYTGKGTANSIAFVRRYLMPDGTYDTHGNKSAVKHETDADPELRTIRFDRKNKKDVLMVNFQTHYGGATGMYPEQVSADFIAPFRDAAEKELDCLFAYYSGAGGNINFKSNIPGERYYETPSDAIVEFMGSTQRAMDAEEKAVLGKVACARSFYPGRVRHDTEERVKQAQEVVSAGVSSPAGVALMGQYGFDSHFEASFVVTRSKLGETLDVPMTALSFGELAFTGHPYEMFHENGKEVRDGSPFKTTFICSLSGDALGYIPSALGYSNGGYETFNCRFAAGTGEELAQEAIRLLKECKNKQ